MIVKLFEIVDMSTLEKLFKAQPVVGSVDPDDIRVLVKKMLSISVSTEHNWDCNHQKVWSVSLKDLVTDTIIPERRAGGILRSLGLWMRRRNDGTKVAWSETQLDILKTIFKEE